MHKKVLSFILFSVLFIYSMPVGAVETKERMLEDEVMYSMVIDRFFDGDSNNNYDIDVNNPNTFNGGDFIGITKKLDYLKDMGFTTIILSPIFLNEKDGYHGYWTADFYQTDRHFGTIDELKQLVNEAHNRDMKVMIDFMVHRVGPNHPWLKDEAKKDWFIEKKDIPFDEKVKKVQMDRLPELNIHHPEVSTYLLDAARWWIQETNIDGYRLMRMQEVETDFWNEFVQAVKDEKDHFYVMGDSVTPKKQMTLSRFQEAGIDMFMNTNQNPYLRMAFSEPDQRLVNLENSPMKLVNFMDTALMPRFTTEAVQANQHPGTRWKLALSFLYTSPGIPYVVYGTEIALNGEESPERQPLMNFKTEQELVEYITKLATIRAKHPAFIHGETDVLLEQDGVIAFKRTLPEETMLVVINNSSKTQTMILDQTQLEPNKELRGELNGDLVRSKEDLYSIVIDREQAEIYQLANKSTINMPYLIALFMVLVAFAIFIMLIYKRSKQNSID